MAFPKEERDELRAAIKRTSRPTRDHLPTDAADRRLIRAAPERLLDALGEAEAERDKMLAECEVVAGTVLQRLDALETENAGLKSKLAKLLKTAIDLREVAFDGPSEPKSLGVAGCTETMSGWKQRIDRDSSAVIAAAKEPQS